ncbi:MAG: hypothetical protein GY898_06095 [Proteobacteria bacterium]|nr:hypothetical protein [Pseudomonadota bacterium]
MASVLTVGELAVELEARTKQFERKMSQSRRELGQFQNSAKRSTAAAGLSFRKLIAPIAAVGAALGAIQLTRGFIDLGKSAVQNAAAFEGYEVRLKALLGSQEGANKALDSFLKLSGRTPFALTQIVEGAATLASVAGGSRDELEELTQVTANLAAVTGLGFQEASGNLQRALAAGIGAADLFRDRGVRKLIEDVNQIPDLTKVSLIELRELFKRTFEPGALSGYGDAAVQLSLTLGGALSNIGDAADRFRIKLGQALSPAVVGVAKGLIIPFFDELTGKIDDNSDALERFFIEGFTKGIDVLANVVEAFGPFIDAIVKAINWIRDLKDEAEIAFQAVGLVVKSIGTGLQVLATGLNAIGTALRVVSHMLGLRTAEEVEEQFLRLNTSVDATVASATDLNKAMARFGKDGPEEVEKNEDAWTKLADKIRGSRDAVRELAEEQIRLRREREAAADEPPPKPPGAGVVDREALKARAALRENQQAVADAQARFDAILAGGFELPDEGLEAFSESISFALTDGISDALDNVLSGEAIDWAQTFADMTGQFFDDTMTDVLADLQGSFSDLFKGLGSQLGGLFGGGEAGGFNLGAGLGAAVGLGGKILQGALRGTDANVRNDLVTSVVTSTQEVRGLVAGPSNIPIAQVGDAIRDAFGGQLTELKRSNTLLEAILASIRGLDLNNFDSGEAIAEAIASEFNGSVALG